MTLSITDTEMTSDITHHTAKPDGRTGGWEVSWMKGAILTRNEAITAMTIAEEVGRALQSGSNVADVALIASLARELDLLCVDAVQMVMAPHT